MDRKILRSWLKAGFLERGVFGHTESGTPQGGIISPVLANMALDGLEEYVQQDYTTQRQQAAAKVNLIRYADDFVITAATPEIAELALLRVQDFLHERGMELSEEKTRIVHIDEGFDFLGQTVRKHGGKYLSRPSKKSCKSLQRKVRETVRTNRTAKQGNLIGLLNPILKGWANYHRYSAASEVFRKMDNQIWQKIWRWCNRRHPNKRPTWVKARYFPFLFGPNKWVFATSKGEKPISLQKLSRIPIERHTKIKSTANPYDPEWHDYFDRLLFDRMLVSLWGKKRLTAIWKRQQGTCPVCSTRITSETGWHLHHIVPRHKGGGDNPLNLVFLHPNCHRQTHHGSTSVVWADDAHLDEYDN